MELIIIEFELFVDASVIVYSSNIIIYLHINILPSLYSLFTTESPGNSPNPVGMDDKRKGGMQIVENSTLDFLTHEHTF